LLEVLQGLLFLHQGEGKKSIKLQPTMLQESGRIKLEGKTSEGHERV